VSSRRHSEAEKQIVTRIRELAQIGCDDPTIAEQLNRDGLYPCRGITFTSSIVRKLRCQYHIYSELERVRQGNLTAYYTMREMGQLLGVENSWLYRAIRDGRLEIEKHPQFDCYLFPKNKDTLINLKQLRDGKIKHISFRKGHQNG